MLNKICTKCNKKKSIKEFSKRKKSPDGFSYVCKSCVKSYNLKYNIKNKSLQKERRRQYYILKKEKINNKNRKNYYDNKNHYKTLAKYYNKQLCLYNRYDGLFPYEEIRRDPNNKDFLQVKCTYCGKWFTPINDQVTKRKKYINDTSSKEAKFYCSSACKSSCSIFGQYKWPKNFKRPRLSIEVNPDFRKYIFELDNWECQRCGIDKKRDSSVVLNCHHIKSKALNSMEESDPDNGITLCKNCHIWIHTNIPWCTYQNLRCSVAV